MPAGKSVAVRAAPALADFVAALPPRGSYALWFGPCTGPPVLAHNADLQHYAASTMKLAMVVSAYREADSGRLDLDGLVSVHTSFRSAADGSAYELDADDDSDLRVWRRAGTEVSLRWLCYRALVRSSNLATNLVLEQVGVAAVQRILAEAGAAASCVTRGIEDVAARDMGMQNVVTAADLAAILQALDAGDLASPRSCEEVLAVLAAAQINDAIPAGLPPGTFVAHKSGWVDGVSHDAAIVRPADAPPFVFVMCTTSDLSEPAALDLIAAGAAAAWADRKVLR